MMGVAQSRGMSPRWRAAMWASIGALLLMPLIAMQLTDQVDWTALDFAFAAALLGGAGVAFEVLTRIVARPAWRIALGCAILGAMLLIWAQGAVGIF